MVSAGNDVLWLPREPQVLTALQSSTDETLVKAAQTLAERLTWPNDGRAKRATVPDLTAAEQAMFEVGAAQYAAICAACHQPNGQGLTGVAPPLAGSEWVTGDPQIPLAVVLHGLIGPVSVQGQDWNMVMPGLGAVPGLLDDEKLAGIVTYIRRSWGNQSSAVTAAEAGRLRSKLADRKQPWTASELKALPATQP